MKVLTAAEMQGADRAAFSRIGVPSRAVMEVAGRAIAEFILMQKLSPDERPVTVVCGAGNNGGDGYVVARTLACHGIQVRVIALRAMAALKGDAKSAAQAWSATCGSNTTELTAEKKLPKSVSDQLQGSALIVDAIFGTGFRGEVSTHEASAIDAMNAAAKKGARIIAVDIPSGVDATTGQLSNAVVRAHYTVSLQCPKVGQLLLPAADQCGALYVVDIGLDVLGDEIVGVSRELLRAEKIQELIDQGFKTGAALHKGSRGHLLVAGGSAGFYGAPKLSALGGLVGGAGLSTAFLPTRGVNSERGDPLEVMCRGGGGSEAESLDRLSVTGFCAALENKSAIVIGPGLGQEESSAEFLSGALKAVKERKLPTVLDADALNLMATRPGLKALIPNDAILTPHPGEMARLSGVSIAAVQADRLGAARKLASELRAVVVLKGARTVIADSQGRVWINPSVTELLATAGSGDVLAGVIGGLCSRGYSAIDAAQIGVFLHGVAGELLEYQGMFGATASTIAHAIPEAFRALRAYQQGAAYRKAHAKYEPVLPGSLPRWFQ